MKLPAFFVAIGLNAALPALPAQTPGTPETRENWNDLEQIARSIERLDDFMRAFTFGVEIQFRERAQNVAGREQILADTTRGLQRSVACMHGRFFEGAEPAEMADRLQLITALTRRVRDASTRLSLFASVRGYLTRFENELDWLNRLYLPAPVEGLPDRLSPAG